MAKDREQKIRDVYEAMTRTIRAIDNTDRDATWPEPGGKTEKRFMGVARAAVDTLDPVKRIELSNGFHAEQFDGRTDFLRFYKDGNDHGLLRRDIVEAWAACAELAAGVSNRDQEIEDLKRRNATLGRIIDTLNPIPEG